MYYLELLEALYRERARYLIVGGLAVNLHGVPRVTNDIDVIISTDRENVLKIANVMKQLGYLPRLPIDPEEIADKKKVRDWIENRNLKAFSFYHQKDQYKIVDIVLDSPLEFEDSYERRSVREVNGIEVCIVSMDDLIRMKEKTGRPQDQSDILMIKKVRDMMGE